MRCQKEVAELGKYLYCIIRCQQDRTFNEAGINDNGGSIYTISYRGLAAVVSDTPVKRYESTRQNMMAHERVLERVMKEFTILPVRFGTVADSASLTQDIHRLLENRSEELHQLLESVDGKVELGLKAFWRNEKAIFEEIIAENATIKRLRDSLSGKTPEATHFDRIRLGEMVKKALNDKRAKEATKILLLLRPIAHNVRENQVVVDSMVVNAAFLIGKNREAEFDQAVSNMNEALGERIAIKYTGPAPPYNFVNIVVNWQS
ncbi:MAG: GvpL/GvpF family gas vesicle protein [Chloroflexi bacterium]|nr:GvpL/GvpF family gas vesicle protein [Chloroflexota bacterium]